MARSSVLIVLDADAVRHARGCPGKLEIFERLGKAGCRYLITRTVRQKELSRDPLIKETLDAWEKRGWLETVPVSTSQLSDVFKARERMKGRRPGNVDLGSVWLAADRGACMITHDLPATELAIAMKVRPVTVLHLAKVALLERIATTADLEAWFEGMSKSYQTVKWEKTVEATINKVTDGSHAVEGLVAALGMARAPNATGAAETTDAETTDAETA